MGELSNNSHPFKGRTLQVVHDLNLEEQATVYDLAKELKQALRDGDKEKIDRFRLNDPNVTVYLIFLENSTRTKESFRNAAAFHHCKVNVFDAATSSFKKNETITDTMKMLSGYSTDQSLFVVRSPQEGTCRWLDDCISEQYCPAHFIPRASFLNAGDGRHEHPTQELLDEFSFLEHKGFERSEIHVALIGDLFHGRTVHSKADGLRIFNKVVVDLVAPDELQMPPSYVEKMKKQGFEVRFHQSIDAYLAAGKVANLWYFTRLQLERMGDRVKDKAQDLRTAVQFRHELLPQLPKNTKFFHPLPRDSTGPTIPYSLDNTEVNSWDRQSQNGYIVRIILLGLFGGCLGGTGQLGEISSSAGQPAKKKPRTANIGDEVNLANLERVREFDFVEDLATSGTPITESKLRMGIGIKPISDGVVVDHIASGQSIEAIWKQIDLVRSVMSWNFIGANGVYKSNTTGQAKGIISLPDFDLSSITRPMLKMLAACCPGCTLNLIEKQSIVKKYRMHCPPRIYNFSQLACRNEMCVSHPDQKQREITPYFFRLGEQGKIFEKSPEEESSEKKFERRRETMSKALFSCKYCDRTHKFFEIWKPRYGDGCSFI